MAERTEADAVAELAAAGNVAFAADGSGQFAVVPEGYKIESLERFQDRPNRIAANHRFVSVASLAAYLGRFATPDTMIVADYAKGHIKATLDGDAPDAPSHKLHLAWFEAVLDERMRAWLALAGKPLRQMEFAQFLEDRAVDVVQPDAATVMEMVIGFEATKKVAFQSSVRLSNGSRQLVYKEDNEQKGALTLPDHFILLLPIYAGMEPERVKFMVRYRIEDGNLSFRVDMHDKEIVLRQAFARCVDSLTTSLALDLPVYVVG